MLRERLSVQLLNGPPARSVAQVAERLLAIQAQDPRGARLAVRARTSGLSAADVDHALTDERSLVISWLNRGTLHLVCSEDLPWLHTLTTPQLFSANARRLAQEGLSPADAERGVAVIDRAIAADGPQTREALRERIAAAGIRTEGQALVHLLMRATLQGLIVRGPMLDGRHAYVLVRDWLPRAPAIDRDRALAELARRFLAGHGPADDRDLARWAGITLRDARSGLAAISGALVQREDGLVDLAGRGPAPELPPPRLLGAFDALLMGWTSREPVLGRHGHIVTSNGIFRAFALVGGRAAATWSLRGAAVELTPLRRLTRAERTALDADAADVTRFLGLS